MPTEAITAAIRSILGNYASPEKIRELDAVLGPIYWREVTEWRVRVLNARNKAMDRAGTLSARESVKLVPEDWHALCDAIGATPGGYHHD